MRAQIEHTANRAYEALSHLDASCPRDEWHKIGRAAIAAGLTIDELDAWSAAGRNYAGTRDVQAAFKSITPEGGTGAGTLFRMARDAGWGGDGLNQSPVRPPRIVEQPRPITPGATAADVWARCTAATNSHPYLVQKGAVGVPLEGLRVVPAGDQLRIMGESMAEALVVPCIAPDGRLSTLQFIPPPEVAARLKANGKPGKLNLPGGKMAGWFTVGKLAAGGTAYVVEGIGQAWACWQATGAASVVAFGAGNMGRVASALRQQDPSYRLVIVPDVGKEAAAVKIAAEIGIAVATMTPGEVDNFDASDLFQRDGLDVLAALLKAAIELPKPEPDTVDLHRNAPRPDPACLYGLIGDIARAGSADTEANPYAIALAALAYLGAAVGRGPYMAVGDDWHHANLFMLHVGRSARGRKGTAKKLVLKLAKAVNGIDEHLAPQIHRGGLSTREGLALLIHDGWTEGKTEVPAIDDKRLMVVESEFANVMHQSGRTGNTLSPALRDTWDGVSIKPATKTSRVWASNPHVAMIADVTPSELLDMLHSRELSNGFANRFLFIWAEGDKVNPFPKPTPPDVIDELAQRIAAVLRFAGADRHVERDILRVELSPEAAKLYANLYRGELRDRSAGERIAGLLDRRAPVFLRLAMLLALTDQSVTIEAAHINAALAWVRYWVDSVKFIFQSAVDEAGAQEVSDTSDKIMTYLKTKGQATRSELTTDCFGGHASKSKIDKALDELISANPPEIEVEAVPRTNGQTGTPTKYYKLRAKCAKSANCGVSIGFAGDFDAVRSVRSVRSVVNTDTNPTSITDEKTPHFAQFAQFANPIKRLETRMDTHTSHSSHTSHAHLENEVPTESPIFEKMETSEPFTPPEEF